MCSCLDDMGAYKRESPFSSKNNMLHVHQEDLEAKLVFSVGMSLFTMQNSGNCSPQRKIGL